jgi:hypothetical protein
MRGRQWRRGLAMFACFLWLLGIEALPAIHLAHHDDHHTHDASGAIVDNGDHQHAAQAADSDRRDLGQLAFDHPIEPGHQADGAAHHAVALLQPLVPAIPLVARKVTQLVPSQAVISIVTIGTQPSARGPPTKA